MARAQRPVPLRCLDSALLFLHSSRDFPGARRNLPIDEPVAELHHPCQERQMCRWSAIGLFTLCIQLACGGNVRELGAAGAAGIAAAAGGMPDAGSEQGGTPGFAGAPSDPCLGKVCDTPPGDNCDSGSELKTYDKMGSCTAGVCSYTSHDVACNCQDHTCIADPCIGVTCASPPASSCKDTRTRTTYAPSGTCNTGTCSYAHTDAACGKNEACTGAGACDTCKTDASCGASCSACGGGTPKCKDLGTTTQCVGCLSDGDCGGATPVCNTTMNTCVERPSCAGLAATCGPIGDGDCCASSIVPGVATATFFRSYDGVTPGYTSKGFPARVSDFRLDTYEITVGRFRNFVQAYSQTMIAGGAGKNPNNSSDPGWDPSLNDSLEMGKTQLIAGVQCDGYETWPAGKDNLPMNCIDWFEAEAFCVWDGGRLPTEAEWNYAAAGGTEQRIYPWGNTPLGPNAELAAYECYYDGIGGVGACTGVGNIAPVGSIPAGNGKWGHADLAGNVSEWVEDWFVDPDPTPCDNCANLEPSTWRDARGGSFDYIASFQLTSSFRGDAVPDGRRGSIGARVRARNP